MIVPKYDVLKPILRDTEFWYTTLFICFMHPHFKECVFVGMKGTKWMEKEGVCYFCSDATVTLLFFHIPGVTVFLGLMLNTIYNDTSEKNVLTPANKGSHTPSQRIKPDEKDGKYCSPFGTPMHGLQWFGDDQIPFKRYGQKVYHGRNSKKGTAESINLTAYNKRTQDNKSMNK